MAIEVNTNNPLGLTVAGPGYGTTGATLYPGQTGDQISSYGYDFAAFPDQSTGIDAGINYINNHINSGKVSTVSELVDLFSPNDLAAFEQTTGLSANDPLDPSQSGLYAAGIAAGEGTLNTFGGLPAFLNANTGAGTTPGSPNPSAPNTGATSASESANPSSSPEGGSSGSWLTDIEDFFIRFGLIIVGGIIILVALWQLLSDHTALPSPGSTAKAAVAAL